MARPVSKLLEKVSLNVNAAAVVKAAQMLTEMSLKELRQSRGTTQTDMADRLNIHQPNIAQLEKRNDVYISTLRDYLEKLGAELEVVARFPDGSAVRINQFSVNK